MHANLHKIFESISQLENFVKNNLKIQNNIFIKYQICNFVQQLKTPSFYDSLALSSIAPP